ALESLNVASAELGSIKGTINGGGDFVDNAPSNDDNYARLIPGEFEINMLNLTLFVSAELYNIKGTINGGGDFVYSLENFLKWKDTGISPPGVKLIKTGTTVAVDVGANGISAIAVLTGRMRAVELETGDTRELSAGTLAVVVPGVGVSAPQSIAPELAQYLESMRDPRTTPSRDTVDTGTIISEAKVLRGGERWTIRMQGEETLRVYARLPWKQVAGAANALEVLVNGKMLTAPVINKSASFTYADGREINYLDSVTGHWTIFYSPDFVSNNTNAGGDYQVVTNPGEAYRYVWDISRLTAGGEPAEVSFRNTITTSNVPLEVRIDASDKSAEIVARQAEGRLPVGEKEVPVRAKVGDDLTGTWSMDYWVWGYSKPRQMTLVQQGSRVTGMMPSAGGNPIRVEGTITSDTLVLDFIYDNLTTLSELVSPDIARQALGIKSHAKFRRDTADTWTGTLSAFYISSSGKTINLKADGGTPGADTRYKPGPTTMKRMP
ncbi:MAG: hypothetical protein NTV30_00695, partial [Chloroflexi bacterium]|nr:hypothetical protein [Chloroflexota bacterium]